jgi:transposase
VLRSSVWSNDRPARGNADLDSCGVTDLRRGFTGLSGMVQTALAENPFSGQVFVFRGRRGDLIKLLWWDGDGLCLFAKRLERGRFIWPQATSGTVSLTKGKRPIPLSITHKFSSKSEAQLDVGQAGQASPNDRVSGSRIIGTREIAPESRDPDQVS